MKLLSKLRVESFLRLLIPIVILSVVGVACVSGSRVFEEPPAAKNLCDVPIDDLEGTLVTFEVPFIYGCYGYVERVKDGIETGEVISKQYLIDANDEYYMSLSLGSDAMGLADELLSECELYLQGLTDKITKTFTVTGKVRKFGGESLQNYYEAIDYDKLTTEEQALFLPLEVSIDDPWSPHYAPLCIGIVALLIAILLCTCSLSGMFQKKLVAKAMAMSNNSPEQIYEYLDYLRQKGQGVRGLYIEGSFVFGRRTVGHFLYGLQDLVWAYQSSTTQKLYGVLPMSTDHSLVLKMADGVYETIQMSEEEAKYMLNEIFTQFPSCAQGYSRELESLYSHSPEALRRVGELQHAQVQE